MKASLVYKLKKTYLPSIAIALLTLSAISGLAKETNPAFYMVESSTRTEIFVGESFDIKLALGNRSSKSPTAELSLNIPEGINFLPLSSGWHQQSFPFWRKIVIGLSLPLRRLTISRT